MICLASVRVLNLLGSRLAPARPGGVGGWDRAENIPLLLGSSLSSLKYFWWAHHELPAVYILWVISNDINMTCFSVGSSARPWRDLCDWVGTKAHINLINISLRCAKGLLHFPGLPRNI